MSTSDPASETVLTEPGGAQPAQVQPGGIAGLPDLAVITRLANQFFAALPGQPQGALAPSPTAVEGATAVPPPSLSSAAIPGNVAPAFSGLPASPPSPANLSPFSIAPSFTGSDLFSFANVPPGMGSTNALVTPATEPAAPELGSIPASLVDAKPLRPDAYSSAAPPAFPGGPDYSFDGNPAPLIAPPSFPSGIEAFSFPQVPGVQPLSGVPSSPSAPQTAPPVAADFSNPFSSRATPAASTDAGAPTADSLKLDSFEFRPELVPDIGFAKRLFDPHVIKRDFPILQEKINGRPLVWLDNAATTQKPNAVIDRVSAFYRHENSNIHRAAHTLAARSTDAYEGAREKVRRFLNASSTREIIFVRGATEGINLVAKSWGHRNVQKDDEIVITWLEHHANIVPWQQLAAEKGARLRVAPVDDSGQIILEEYEKLLGPRTRIVSFSQVSNALGTITPAKPMIEMAHRHGAKVLLDAAQSVAHMATDVQALDCDFLVLSGHKIFAPTGVGVVFGKGDLLETTPPWQGGGNMIIDVTFEKTIYNVPPARFEAGTGTIADAVGLGAALDYLEEIGLENISNYEHELVQYGTAQLLTVPGLRLIGTAKEKAGVLSFVLDSIPPEEVGKALDQEGIAVRAGHHCAQPILRRLGVEKTVRPSLALYNTREDLDALVAALLRIQAGRP